MLCSSFCSIMSFSWLCCNASIWRKNSGGAGILRSFFQILPVVKMLIIIFLLRLAWSGRERDVQCCWWFGLWRRYVLESQKRPKRSVLLNIAQQLWGHFAIQILAFASNSITLSILSHFHFAICNFKMYLILISNNM